MPSVEVMQKKLDAKFAVKAVDDATGEFEGYASTYSVDQSGEKIAKGAWKRTLSHNGGAVPILFGHSTMEPCGWNLEAREDEHGLYVKGKLHLETEVGKKAYYFLKGAKEAGGKGGLSVGFRVLKDHWEKDPQTKEETRVYDEVQLMEYSVVVFPCQLEAYTTQIKHQHDSELQKGDKPTASVDGVEHPASDFAYVPDPEKPSTWKFPIFDANHVRNALARWSQADIPAEDKPKVLARIHAAAKRFGIDVSDSDGKQAAEIPNTKDEPMSQSHTDFQAALAQQQRARNLRQDRSDIENALHNSLESIHASDMPKEEKKSAVKKTYNDYADAMSDHHIKSYLGDEEHSGSTSPEMPQYRSADVSESIGKDLLLAALTTKGKMPAAKKAAMKHALSLHDSAIELHHKAMSVCKAMIDGSDESGEEMGAMSGEDPDHTKAAEATPNAEEDLSEYLATLPKFTLSEAA